MKAFVLAAGLGTRLRPFTLNHPKALVPVGGIPMLQRVLLRLKEEGFREVTINVHHFADQITDFLRAKDNFGLQINISDEREELLDTGGAILYARHFLAADNAPFLVHNVDILTDAPLRELMSRHEESGYGATLLVSNRQSSRRLIFQEAGKDSPSADNKIIKTFPFHQGNEHILCGWHNVDTGQYRPCNFILRSDMRQFAFSGIHVMSPDRIYSEMERQKREGKFSVIDFYLDAVGEMPAEGYIVENINLIDIGKPATLAQANTLFIKN